MTSIPCPQCPGHDVGDGHSCIEQRQNAVTLWDLFKRVERAMRHSHYTPPPDSLSADEFVDKENE